VNSGGKTLEERRSSLDAEIDSLTSILADLESSSPYKPRSQQGIGSVAGKIGFPWQPDKRILSTDVVMLSYLLGLMGISKPTQATGIPGGSPGATPTVSTPVTGHKRMVIPNQPPLTATKKSATPKPGVQPIPVTPVGPLKPQPVPASYTTAATPTRPPFNVQVKSAHPAPHFPPSPPQYGGLAPQPASSIGPYAPAQPRAPDYGYVPPPVGYGSAPPPSRQPEPAYAGSASLRGWDGAEPSYGPPSAWKPEPAYPPAVGQYPSSGARKSHGFEPAPTSQPPALQPK
ncbi:hypothetical protein Chor_012802, partial [Crotalus horridus]